jgi:hypothetical protein
MLKYQQIGYYSVHRPLVLQIYSCWLLNLWLSLLIFLKWFAAVFRIRIHRIHIFLGILYPDPDPLVRGMDPDKALDPDPSIIMQK